ncbi:serine/arginine repetitive matrix protein 1-like [Tympanuchus pallidicinctus]|uniref:serine/arginine repetitive matrix protein 1-like n=1 Tax=Tympanuchus pallidicinctus TaxID=109042 RepID=UPI0022872069|nr:serine/arginine repetitive matrix protein 1-like [Tympanuchus pallidicinctus]
MAPAVRCRRWAAARCPPSAAAARTELPPPPPPLPSPPTPPPLPPPRRASAPPPLQRPLRRSRRGAAALPHGAYARRRPDALNGSAPRSRRRLLRPSPPPRTPAHTAPARLSRRAALAASGSAPRLGAGLRRALAAAPHVSSLAPASRGARLGCYFLPARPLFAASRVREIKVRSAAILEAGTRRKAKAASAGRGICPQQRWVAASTGRAGRLRLPSFFWNAVTPSADCRARRALRRGGRKSGTRSCSSGTSVSPPHRREESCRHRPRRGLEAGSPLLAVKPAVPLTARNSRRCRLPPLARAGTAASRRGKKGGWPREAAALHFRPGLLVATEGSAFPV